MKKQAIIKTAGPLSSKDLDALRLRFETLLGEKLEWKVEEDPTLIGGFTAYIDGKLYDMSMLSRLKTALKPDTANDSIDTTEEKNIFSPADQNKDVNLTSAHLKAKLNRVKQVSQIYEYGTVLSSGDGLVHLTGLSQSRYSELLEFENDAYGLALDLSIDGVSAVLLSGAYQVSAGSIARRTGRVADICVGPELLGRVVDPLGRPLDGKPLYTERHRNIECPAPSIMDRAPVNQPLQTGLLSIDSMIPIGKGQRELIIGDRQTGKTSIALSAILNQKDKKVICIYCAIGQKASTVAQFIHTLKIKGAMENCIVVSATASDCPAMQYIAPYAGCAIAEDFMYQGRNVLIVYDDLSKHAIAYRTISLLLKRPPGREAYPGDIFYLHSRLLERAAKLSPKLGGGSMTALPIVETMAGDISAYIPTNVISITDGQIYLESELFNAGVRPAVNVGLSVSRVGRMAMPQAMKEVSGQLRLELAQYRELAVFAQFGADIDPATKGMLERGERLTELIKQNQKIIYKLSEQAAILLAYSANAYQKIPVVQVSSFTSGLLSHLWDTDRGAMESIDLTEQLSDQTKKELLHSIMEYGKRNKPEA